MDKDERVKCHADPGKTLRRDKGAKKLPRVGWREMHDCMSGQREEHLSWIAEPSKRLYQGCCRLF